MQGSQDELRRILQEKLLEYEVGVPRASRDFIFANIGRLGRNRLSKNLLYSVAVLLSLSSYFIYENAFSDNEVQNAKAGIDHPANADRIMSGMIEIPALKHTLDNRSVIRAHNSTDAV